MINLNGGAGGGTIDNEGTGLLEFTSNLMVSGTDIWAGAASDGDLGTISTNAKTLTPTGSATGWLAGTIPNTASGAGSSLTSVAKTGTDLWTLSGSNTYSGTTTINAGTLEFAKEVSLYNNSPGSWTAANIVVAGGATLALKVGGANEFTATDIGAIAALGTASGGFASGAILGLDTSDATGSFSYGGVIANPNSGANVLGLTKLGPNTLVLSASNTYSGPTAVSDGTLADRQRRQRGLDRLHQRRGPQQRGRHRLQPYGPRDVRARHQRRRQPHADGQRPADAQRHQYLQRHDHDQRRRARRRAVRTRTPRARSARVPSARY